MWMSVTKRQDAVWDTAWSKHLSTCMPYASIGTSPGFVSLEDDSFSLSV